MPASNGPKFTINEVPHFADHDTAREFLEAQRWPDGIPYCPHCGEIGRSYRLNTKRKGVWKCGGCRKQFTVTVGTIFEDSHIPLHKWLMAFHLLCSSKKGHSAHQLHRMLGVTYKSAWFMAHRIRYAMTQEPLSSKLSGVVEIDETYVGGKEKGTGLRGAGNRDSKKVPVVSMVERHLVEDEETGEMKPSGKGRVRSKAVQRVTVITSSRSLKMSWRKIPSSTRMRQLCITFSPKTTLATASSTTRKRSTSALRTAGRSRPTRLRDTSAF
jgi:transposase-like protein